MQDTPADSAAGAVRRQSSRVQKREAEQVRRLSHVHLRVHLQQAVNLSESSLTSDSIPAQLQRAVILSLPPHHNAMCCRCRARSPSPLTTRTTRRVQRQLAQQQGRLRRTMRGNAHRRPCRCLQGALLSHVMAQGILRCRSCRAPCCARWCPTPDLPTRQAWRDRGLQHACVRSSSM